MEKAINTFVKGMITDTSSAQQPEGSWAYALNAVFGTWEGDLSTLANECGNVVCIDLSPTETIEYTLIGANILPDNMVALFFTDDVVSIIGIMNPIDCSFEIKVKATCLQFKRHVQLNTRSRIIKNCERIIYFTDKLTEYKSVNLDSLGQYLTVDSNGNAIASLTPSSPNYANNNGVFQTAWNCVKFNHFLSYIPGCIKIEDVYDGGGHITAGGHQFTYRYLDSDLNSTNWAVLTHPVFIYNESIDSANADGETAGTPTAKCVNFKFADLDPTFTFIQLAVTSGIQGTGTPQDETFILDIIQIDVINSKGTAKYTYCGFNETSHVVSSLMELTVPVIPFTGVVAHEILDNRLMIGNVRNTVLDFAAMQRAVIKARVKWRTYQDEELNPLAIKQNAAKNAVVIAERKTFMRDEIYALGVVFLLDDGSETPAFHIPGRKPNIDYDGSDLTTAYQPYTKNRHLTRGDNPTVNEWDTKELSVIYDAQMTHAKLDNSVGHSNVQHLLGSDVCTSLEEVSGYTTINYSFDTPSPNGPCRFILYLNNHPNTQAIVRLTTFGGGSRPDAPSKNYGVDTVVKTLTHSDNDLWVTTQFINKSINDNRHNTWVSIQILYYDGQTGKGYSELIGGNTFKILAYHTSFLELKESPHKFFNCQPIPRWKVHNTFVVTDDRLDGAEGLMGYHENEGSRYPLAKDCDENYVFNAAAVGGEDLAGMPIRHHRIPDCGGDAGQHDYYQNTMGLTQRTFLDNDGVVDGTNGSPLRKRVVLNKIGLVVDMVEVYATIPLEIRSRIKGHYIMYGERTSTNKTIVDKGYAWRNANRSDFYTCFLQRGTNYLYGSRAFFQYGPLYGFTTDASYSDIAPILPGAEGIHKHYHYEIQSGIRAELCFTSSLPTYLTFGHNRGSIYYDYNIGQPNHTHGSLENVCEYISPTTVFNRSTISGEFIKIECPITSYSPREETSDVIIGKMYPLDSGALVLQQHAEFDTAMHLNFDHIATFLSPQNKDWSNGTRIEPHDIALWGFHRQILGAAIIDYNDTGTATGFSVPITLHSAMYGQEASFYQTTVPFPAVANPALMNVGNLVRGFDEFPGEVAKMMTKQSISNFYCAIKVSKDVFSSLENITYHRLNICHIPRLGSSPRFDNELIYGGDTFITKMRGVKTFSQNKGGSAMNGFNKIRAIAYSMEGYCESDSINSSLSHSDVPESNYPPKSMPYFNYTNMGRDRKESFNLQTLWKDDDLTDNKTMPHYFWRQFKFQYNKDFGFNHTQNPGFPLSDTFNYCSSCSGRQSNSIYYSNKGFAQDKIDSFKKVLAQNTFAIPSETGPITNMFLEKDQLYTHTNKALYSVQTKPQQLNTSEASIFVGTGDVGSIPPTRMFSVPYGHAGSVDAFATISTQFGTFFIDSSSGRIFMLGEGLNEISNAGMRQRFHTDIPLIFRKQYFAATKKGYPMYDTSANNSVGYQAVYEPRLNRLIIHKKDYAFRKFNNSGAAINLSLGTRPSVGVENTIYQSINTLAQNKVTFFRWLSTGPGEGYYEEINLNNIEWFENKSWTMSYSLDGKFWVSYHSYQPNFMFNDDKHFYSFINAPTQGSKVWKHSDLNHQTYYGVKYDHIIDIISSNQGSEKVTHSIQIIANTYMFNTLHDDFTKVENITFDRFNAYNSKQSSTLRDLIVKVPNQYQDIRLNPTQTLMDRTENYWRFNKFRDEVIDLAVPIISKSWVNTQLYYSNLGQGYVDSVIDPTAVSNTKSIYSQSRFRDKFFGIRLHFKPEGDYKIVTEVTSLLNNISLR